jgi:hypothetical protein
MESRGSRGFSRAVNSRKPDLVGRISTYKHSQQENDNAIHPVQRVGGCGQAIVGQSSFGKPKTSGQENDEETVSRYLGY